MNRAQICVIDYLSCPQPRGEMAQMAFSEECEEAQSRLVMAEFGYLFERDGLKPETKIMAMKRAAVFSLKMLVERSKIRRILGEPDDLMGEGSEF